MKKDISKVRKEKELPPRNAARQEGSTTKLKAKVDKKRKERPRE